MEASHSNMQGILWIINKVHQLYPEKDIGEYVMHYLTERNQYLVVLSSGRRISIHRQIAQDAETTPSSVSGTDIFRVIQTIRD